MQKQPENRDFDGFRLLFLCSNTPIHFGTILVLLAPFQAETFAKPYFQTEKIEPLLFPRRWVRE